MKYGIEMQYTDECSCDDYAMFTEIIAVYDDNYEAQRIADYLNEHNTVDTRADYFRVIEIAYNPTLDEVIEYAKDFA